MCPALACLLMYCMQDLLERRRPAAASVGLIIRPKVFDADPSSSRDVVLASPCSSVDPSTPSPSPQYSASKSMFLTTTRPKQGVLSITQAGTDKLGKLDFAYHNNECLMCRWKARMQMAFSCCFASTSCGLYFLASNPFSTGSRS